MAKAIFFVIARRQTLPRAFRSVERAARGRFFEGAPHFGECGRVTQTSRVARCCRDSAQLDEQLVHKRVPQGTVG
jgi:hypothetical protein